MREQSPFSRFARWAAYTAGRPSTFGIAVTAIAIWALSGLVLGYSDTWQLMINSGTAIITLLIVFLIQHTQNRDSMATQLKLDEIIRSIDGAHKALLDYEELEEHELQTIHQRYEGLARQARERMRRGERDTEPHDVEIS